MWFIRQYYELWKEWNRCGGSTKSCEMLGKISTQTHVLSQLFSIGRILPKARRGPTSFLRATPAAGSRSAFSGQIQVNRLIRAMLSDKTHRKLIKNVIELHGNQLGL